MLTLATALLTARRPPAPVTTLEITNKSPLSAPVPTFKPFVPVRLIVAPGAVRVVWELLVCPYVSEPSVKLVSAKLFTVPAGVTAPESKNFTSLLEPGAPLGVQLPARDQLVFAPAGVQTFTGLNGAVTLIVTTKVFAIGVTALSGGLVLPTIVTV